MGDNSGRFGICAWLGPLQRLLTDKTVATLTFSISRLVCSVKTRNRLAARHTKTTSTATMGPTASTSSALPLWLERNSTDMRVIQDILATREEQRHLIALTRVERLRNVQGLSEAARDAFKAEAATLPHNQYKNRYADIVPYDRTRVVLSDRQDERDTYINASWVLEQPPRGHQASSTSSSNAERTWISCQAPLPETTHDFLSMFLSPPTGVDGYVPSQLPAPRTIVMLTACEESGRQKSHRYWPSQIGQAVTFKHHLFPANAHTQDSRQSPPIEVTWLTSTPSSVQDERKRRGWRTNRLRLSTVGKEVEVNFIEYLGWQDHGVPDDPQEVLRLAEHVNSLIRPSKEPIVVHCSAGVGRTGSFVAISLLLECLERLKAGDESGLDILRQTSQASPLGPLPFPRANERSTSSGSNSQHSHLLPSFLRKDSSVGTKTGGTASSAASDRDVRSADSTFDPVMAAIDYLRDQRTTMVQTPGQVEYVYRCCKMWWSGR